MFPSSSPQSSSFVFSEKDFKGFKDFKKNEKINWGERNRLGLLPLYWVIDNDKWTLFQKIVEHCQKTDEDIFMNDLSIWLCITKHAKGPRYLERLLSLGMKTNFSNSYTRLPLIIEAAQGGTPELIHTLIKSGVNMNETDSSGDTALMWAASGGEACNIENLKALLQYKPKLNHFNKLGEDALAVSCREWPLTLPELLKAGASPFHRYENGKTLLMMFSWIDEEPSSHFESLGYPQAIDMLLEIGLSLDDVDKKGHNVLSYYTKSNPLTAYFVKKQREQLEKKLPLAQSKCNKTIKNKTIRL